jgi:hypothetical protein
MLCKSCQKLDEHKQFMLNYCEICRGKIAGVNHGLPQLCLQCSKTYNLCHECQTPIQPSNPKILVRRTY